MSVLVLGSFMMDLVVSTTRAPQAGETIIGTGFKRFPGGKGANQAVAARRLGASVKMIGKVGADEFGREFLALFRAEDIDVSHVRVADHESTGIGSIIIEESGQNRIVVVPGANMAFTKEEISLLESEIAQARLLVVQLEMDLVMIEQAIEIAYRYGVPILLNPAPAQALSDALLSKIDYLTPNETELALMSNMAIKSTSDAQKAARYLLNKGVGTIIVTMAEKGAMLCTKDESRLIEGFGVNAVDTVAAGDSFNGALAAMLMAGKNLDEAIIYANAVGALTVTKIGAIPSLPTEHEVERFLQSQS